MQAAFSVYENQKVPLTQHILKAKPLQSVIIFCSTKSSTKRLSKELKALKFSCEDIHSDLEQSKREEVLRDFKNRKLNILVATDILSRGIDVEDIDLQPGSSNICFCLRRNRTLVGKLSYQLSATNMGVSQSEISWINDILQLWLKQRVRSV